MQERLKNQPLYLKLVNFRPRLWQASLILLIAILMINDQTKFRRILRVWRCKWEKSIGKQKPAIGLMYAESRRTWEMDYACSFMYRVVRLLFVSFIPLVLGLHFVLSILFLQFTGKGIVSVSIIQSFLICILHIET